MSKQSSHFGSTVKPAIKAVILTRVSSKEQEEGYSIEAQKHRLQTYCERRGLKIEKIFEVVESSTQGERTQFMEMIKFVKSYRETIAIVADKVDRVQRSFKEYPMLDALIQEGKIELHFNTENYIIHKNSVSQERLMWSMGVIMAQSYVDNLRDNVKRSIDQKIRQGEWIALAPLGYLNVKDMRGRSDIIIDEQRAAHIQKIFELYATGSHTLEEIRQYCKKQGIRNRVGKKESLTRSQIHQIINNPFYYGRMMIKGQLFDHRYSPLISKKMFDQCQAVLHGWKKKPFKWAGKEFIFRGLIKCATTDKVVTADTKRKTYTNGKTAEWTYLRCGNPTNTEKVMWVKEEEVIKQVEQILKSIQIPREVLVEIKDYMREIQQSEELFLSRQLAEYQKEHTLIQNKVNSLVDLLLEKTIDKTDFDRKKSQLREQQIDIENFIAAHRHGDDGFKDALISIISILSEAYEVFRGSQIAQKRQLLNIVFANLTLKGANLCYDLRKPFELFINVPNIEEWRPLIDSLRTDLELRSLIINFADTFSFTEISKLV